MIPEELKEIKERAKFALSGPWIQWRTPVSVDRVEIYDGTKEKAGVHICTVFGDRNNSEFIAHARTDIPKLIEVLEEAKYQLDVAIDVIEHYSKQTQFHRNDTNFANEYLKKIGRVE